MKSLIRSFAFLALALFFGTSAGFAATVTAGPTGQYPSPCAAFPNLQDGDTLLVDANNGIPYVTGGCVEYANNVTISGVNGRPIIDPEGRSVFDGLWSIHGHDVVIDNIEFRNTVGVGGSPNRPAIRIKSGLTTSPGGGNVTVQRCYVYNDAMGLLSDNVGFGGYTKYAWYSANPYITLQYDEFAFDGNGGGQNHNIYLSAGGNMTLNMKYTFSHDSNSGHELKSRAEHNNVYYNFIGDLRGLSDYIVDFPLGGDTYMVGNVLYKADACSDCNSAFVVYRQYTDTKGSGAYPAPHDDMHFVNNTAIDGPNNEFSGLTQFVGMACYSLGVTTDNCPLPSGGGGPLTTPGVFENNIFVGPAGFTITNQTEAVLHGNVVLTNNSTNLADLFVDPAHLDFHLASGSPAIGAGIYPPTDNTGAADPLVLATEEYEHPLSSVARPTPSGSTMDAGAYSYPRADNPPTLQLSYNNTVTAPSSGTITVSGMPAPASGQFNYVELVSGNTSVIPRIETAETATGSVTVSYQTNPIASTVTVPIEIYADGAHATATITVNPGPPTLYSVTAAGSKYLASDTVHLEGPAPAGGVVVQLTSSDPSILYAPASITVPAGQISVSAGTLATTFFSGNYQSETLTATAGSVTKTLTRNVYTPRFGNFGCNVCTVVGGQAAKIGAVISYGPAPESGGDVTVTSDHPDVVPDQTALHVSPGATDFPSNGPSTGFVVNTNPVTQETTVKITANFGPYSTGTATLTVNPSAAGSPSSIAVVSGSGQSADVGSNFSNPLVVLVEDSSSNPVQGVTVTCSGTGVSFPNGATATTGSNGEASVVAQPTQTGSLTVTASVSGVSTPATFSETGTAASPASVAVASGSGQSADVGSNFPNPLVALVEDANSNPVQGVTVTFAGTGVSFPNGATATTGSNGQASVVAQPTQSGLLTVTASVAGVSTPATFSETGNATGATLESITSDSSQNYDPRTTVHLTGAATAPVVVQLSSSDPSAMYVPATVTVPEGASSTETGSLLGSLWGQSPLTKTATISATYNGVTKTVTKSLRTAGIHAFSCHNSGAVTGGQPISCTVALINLVPYGGTTGQITSNNPSVVPTQTFPMSQGAGNVYPSVSTNAVSTTTTVVVTAHYNGATYNTTLTVNPGANTPASIAAVSGGGQSANVGSNFANPLVVVVENASSNPVQGATVTFSGTGVSFPNGATDTTGSNGEASVVVQPTQTGSLTISASVTGVSTPATFSETGTSPVDLGSITAPSSTARYVKVNLTGPAPAGGVVVTLSSSDPSAVYLPATVTVPAGETSAYAGALNGSLWGQSPTFKSATLTASYGGVTKTVTRSFHTVKLHGVFGGGSITGGDASNVYIQSAYGAPAYGSNPVTFTSDNTAVIPNQTFNLTSADQNFSLQTNTVSATTTVHVTVDYNGDQVTLTYTVNP